MKMNFNIGVIIENVIENIGLIILNIMYINKITTVKIIMSSSFFVNIQKKF